MGDIKIWSSISWQWDPADKICIGFMFIHFVFSFLNKGCNLVLMGKKALAHCTSSLLLLTPVRGLFHNLDPIFQLVPCSLWCKRCTRTRWRGRGLLLSRWAGSQGWSLTDCVATPSPQHSRLYICHCRLLFFQASAVIGRLCRTCQTMYDEFVIHGCRPPPPPTFCTHPFVCIFHKYTVAVEEEWHFRRTWALAGFSLRVRSA